MTGNSYDDFLVNYDELYYYKMFMSIYGLWISGYYFSSFASSYSKSNKTSDKSISDLFLWPISIDFDL